LLKDTSFGNVHHHRAGAAGARDVEGLLHRPRQVAHVLHQEVVLDDGAGDADGVALLEGIQADRGVGTWPVMITIGMRVHVGRGDAGDGIRHAGAGGDQRHADLTGGAGVAVGRVHRGLLVAHQHVLDGVLLVERVVDVSTAPPG
jgi:hypothetical protein